jgi:hypothetical protein
MLGAQGWVSGLTSAFPQESVALVAAFERGDMKRRCASIAGSCPCCTSTPSMTWSSRSSSPSRSWAAVRNACACPRLPLEGAAPRRGDRHGREGRRHRRPEPARPTPPSHMRPHLLLHRRPHGGQSGSPGRGRRAAAARRVDERPAHRLPRPLRLDPHRPDVRAARPRHDVGRVPLSAHAARCRRRHPVHRDQRLPADVRPRHDRHGHLRPGERPDHPAHARQAAGGSAGRRHRHRI